MEAFMDQLNQVVVSLQSVMSGKVLVVLLVGTGIWFTIRLRGVQFREFGKSLKAVFGGINLNGAKAGKDGMSSFQALTTAIAAQVGTGNLAGAATAMVMGGPGAIFWMWVSAIFGMATIFVEASLAQKYKTVDENGEVTGGPAYYIRAAYKGTFGKVLAVIFAILISIALGLFGNMVQSNSIGAAFTEVFQVYGINIPPITIGLVLAVLAGFIFIGGTKRLAAVVEKVVPVMAGVYIVGSLILIGLHINHVPTAFMMIIKGAFDPKAVMGAGAGITVREAIRFGVARGLFSNEAGMGSTPHAHARAKAESPHHQGLCAMISVFIDTFVILNLTVFAVLTTDAMSSGKDGTALTQAAFMQSFGNFGSIFIAICLLFFAFSTILGWHFFGLTNAKYLFGEGAAKVYSFIVVICIVIGSMLKVNLVWALADFFNALMVIPNVLALLALSHVVVAADRKAEAITKNVTQAYQVAEEK